LLYFIIFLIGIVAGNVTGIIGASGVAVVVPAFVLLGYAPSKAIGASLFIDTIASLIVSWTYYQNKNLVIKKAIWIAVGSMIGAQIGSLLSPFIPDMGLNSAFSAFLFISAAIFWLRGKYGMLPTENEGRRYFKIIKYLQKNEKFFGILLGFLTGIMSGIIGTGGGVMILLILVIIMGFTMHEGIGTSTLIMAFTAGSGAIGHALSSDLPIDVAIIGSIGTIVGGRIAAKFANKIDDKILSKVAVGLFIVLGISMLIITRKFQHIG
jgi:uncharacterized membrane protein YfcA